jgi:hypothetical protein
MDYRNPDRQEYDAQGEYRKDINSRRTPGNIPVEVMRRVRHAEFSSVMSDPSVVAAMNPGFTTKVAKIMMLDKEARIEAVTELTDPEEIKGAMIAERDPDVVRYLADRYAEALLAVTG